MTANAKLANYLEEGAALEMLARVRVLVPYAGIIQIRYNGIHKSDLSL